LSNIIIGEIDAKDFSHSVAMAGPSVAKKVPILSTFSFVSCFPLTFVPMLVLSEWRRRESNQSQYLYAYKVNEVSVIRVNMLVRLNFLTAAATFGAGPPYSQSRLQPCL
jgi:hypothetical protein